MILNNTATGAAEGSAPVSNTVPVTVIGTTLAVTKTVSQPQALPTQNVVYTIGVTNTGANDAVGTVTDPLPAGMNFQAETDPGSPWVVTTPSVGSGGTVTFSDSSPLAPGASASFTITAQVNSSTPPSPPTLNNTATATATDATSASRTVGLTVVGPIITLAANTFSIGRDAVNPNLIDFNYDGHLYQQLADTIQQINLNGLPGNDSLTVDSTHGLLNNMTTPMSPTVPIMAIPINFTGSTNGINSLILTQGAGGPTLTSDTLSVGTAPLSTGESSISDGAGNTQTVFFYNLSPLFDSTPAPALNIVPNIPASLLNAANTINYAEGDDPTLTPKPAWGQVTVDSFEPLNFTAKGTLVIDSGPGVDNVNVNNPNVPAGPTAGSFLTGITVAAGGPSAKLTVNGSGGADAISYAPTVPGAGSVSDTPPTGPALPVLTFSGIGSLAINGQGGGDALTLTSPTGSQVTLAPGSAIDSGTLTMTSGGAAPSTLTPLSYSNLGGTGQSATGAQLTIGGAAALIYDGLTGNDTFTVAATTGKVTLSSTATGVSQIPVLTTGVTTLVLNGNGGDTFDVTGPQPFTSIALEGDAVANLTGNGTAIAMTLGGSSQTLTGGGLGTVTLTGIGVVNLAAAGGAVTVNGTAGLTDNIAVSPTGAAAAQIQDNGSGPMILLTGSGTLTASGNAGDSDTVTVYGTAGNDTITVVGSATNPTVTVKNPSALLPVTVVATDTAALVINSGLGTDTVSVDSTAGPVTVPVTYDGGPTDSLSLVGGTATTDVYTPGPVAGAGQSVLTFPAGTETVYFSGIAPVPDTVAAASLTVNGTSASNAIKYQAGSLAGTGLVTVDNFEPITFSNKVALDIDSMGGADTITVNTTKIPTGLTDISVTGGGGNDTLIVNANGNTVSSADVTPTTVTTAVTPVAVGYGGISVISIINSKNSLTGTALAAPIAAVAGVPLNSVLVGSFAFTDQPPSESSNPAEFAVTINWGDGTVAAPDLTGGTILQLAPNASGVVEFQVYGTHTYSTQGTFPVNVTIADLGSTRTFTPTGSTVPVTIVANPGATTTVSPISSSTNVASAPLIPQSGGSPINAVVGTLFTGVVATFVDTNPGASVANYPNGQTPPSIVINWEGAAWRHLHDRHQLGEREQGDRGQCGESALRDILRRLPDRRRPAGG